MRSLKFRAWLKNYSCYAEVLGFDRGKLIVHCQTGELVMHRLHVPLKDCILEQYTGLKDKNGNEIYEGDVLESTWNGDKAVVVWNNVEGEWEHYADFNAYSKYGGSVVIDNIHENPGLLEEGK